jgi:hypothetical protein
MSDRALAIHRNIQAYYGEMMDEHDRYRSWEHCYRYFRHQRTLATPFDRDHAALHLGFYLAGWGMYRGSSFLLQYAYTAHLGVIDKLLTPRFAVLWDHEFGTNGSDLKLVPTIIEAVHAVREAYRPFAPASESRQASDTLVTKVLLGTFGCLPACDRFFIDGFKAEGFRYSYLNVAFIHRILRFCVDHSVHLRRERGSIVLASGFRYPLMKLVDMYFWQIGFDLDKSRRTDPGGPRTPGPAKSE